MKRKTHADRVMEHMKSRGEITQREAFYMGVYRLADVIFKLKKKLKEDGGYVINTEYRDVVNRDGSHSRIAVYSLEVIEE